MNYGTYWWSNSVYVAAIGPSDNGSACYWPPGSLHTLGTGDIYNKRFVFFMWTQILCIEYILRKILPTKFMFDFVIILKRLTVKDAAINNYDLNIPAFIAYVYRGGC